MNYENLTPEQKENIADLARIGQCAELLALTAFKTNLSIENCLPLIIGVAQQKLAEMRA